MSRFRPSARALLLLALGCLPLPASAARWFEIELLVFAHETVDAGNELWPADPGRPDLLAARPLLPYDQPDEGAFGFRRLEPEQLQLTGAAERLRRSSRYRVLFHEAWRQPVGNRDDAPWVQVLAGDATTAALPQPPGGLAPETAPETAPAPLAGAVRLSVRRYLHLDVDLVRSDRLVAGAIPAATSSGVVAIPLGAAQETPAATGEAAQTAWWQPFRMRQSRRMRSDEIHHLDHPAFGLLVRVSPFELPPSPAAVAPAGSLEPPVETPTASGTPGEAGSPAATETPGEPPAAAGPATSTTPLALPPALPAGTARPPQ